MKTRRTPPKKKKPLGDARPSPEPVMARSRSPNKVRVCVGGKTFMSTPDTLTKASYFEVLLNGAFKREEEYFVDRSPEFFQHILQPLGPHSVRLLFIFSNPCFFSRALLASRGFSAQALRLRRATSRCIARSCCSSAPITASTISPISSKVGRVCGISVIAIASLSRARTS